MWKWIKDCIVAVGGIVLYFLHELQSIKVWVMIFLCYLLYQSIMTRFESIALQIALPFVLGFMFHLRSQETKVKLENK